VAADLRHGALRDLEAARRDRAFVSPDTVAAVELMDAIGAAWVNKKVSSEVSSEVSPLESPRCAPLDRSSMTVSAASAELDISPQAVRGLLKRGTLRGEQRADRSWRVSAEDVAARKDKP
jgi:hypothetical protein